MVATAIYFVRMVLWKETAFPLCRAMERRWKRNVVIMLGMLLLLLLKPTAETAFCWNSMRPVRHRCLLSVFSSVVPNLQTVQIAGRSELKSQKEQPIANLHCVD